MKLSEMTPDQVADIRREHARAALIGLLAGPPPNANSMISTSPVDVAFRYADEMIDVELQLEHGPRRID